MSKRGHASGMGGQEEYAVADPYVWVGLDGGLGSAGAMAAAAAGGSSGAGALHAAANDSDFEAADESEPGSEDYSSSSDEEEETKPARKKAARGSGAAPKAAPKPRKQAKAKKETSGPRIGAKKAKKLYLLDDSDLAQMKDVKGVYHGFFAYSRMYARKELEEYARAKHAGSEWYSRRLAMYKASDESKRERKRGYRATQMAAALQRVEQYAVPNKAIEVEQYGETKLPDSVLANVMVCLAKTREPGGLRGFACVAKDLANASLANWDFYRAAKEGWAVLGEDAKSNPHPPVPRGPPYSYHHSGFFSSFLYGSTLQGLPGSLGWEFWEGFLRDPLKPKAKELQEAMRAVQLSPKGTKAEMAERILRAFGLSAATAVPVQLLQVVKLERSRRLAWDGPDSHDPFIRVNKAIDQLIAADAATWGDLKATRDGAGRGVAYIRATIRQRFSSIDEFVGAAETADQERQRREKEEEDAAAAAAIGAAAAQEAEAAAAAAIAAAAAGAVASAAPPPAARAVYQPPTRPQYQPPTRPQYQPPTGWPGTRPQHQPPTRQIGAFAPPVASGGGMLLPPANPTAASAPEAAAAGGGMGGPAGYAGLQALNPPSQQVAPPAVPAAVAHMQAALAAFAGQGGGNVPQQDMPAALAQFLLQSWGRG